MPSISPFISGNKNTQPASSMAIAASPGQKEFFPADFVLTIVILYHRPFHNNAGRFPPDQAPKYGCPRCFRPKAAGSTYLYRRRIEAGDSVSRNLILNPGQIRQVNSSPQRHSLGICFCQSIHTVASNYSAFPNNGGTGAIMLY